MAWTHYIIVGFAFASLFFVLAAFALYWAYRNGQLNELEDGAKTIFDDEEPMGQVTDQFPSKKDETSSTKKNHE
ncbi:MAG: cbb3-type cytochrome oxidase assembly protein [Opitutales bacterium]|nr:cbb3-type cytochrome oxidase assembly protein [Opitutales bacterium]